MEFLHKLLADFEFALAGLFGAFISAPFNSDIKTGRDRIMFVLTGAACAYYLTGLVSARFDILPASAGGVGFLLGAFGGSLLAAVLRAIRAADLWQLVRQRFGKPEGGAE